MERFFNCSNNIRDTILLFVCIRLCRQMQTFLWIPQPQTADLPPMCCWSTFFVLFSIDNQSWNMYYRGHLRGVLYWDMITLSKLRCPVSVCVLCVACVSYFEPDIARLIMSRLACLVQSVNVCGVHFTDNIATWCSIIFLLLFLPSGGVFSPGAIFNKTSLVDRLNERGIKFTITSAAQPINA